MVALGERLQLAASKLEHLELRPCASEEGFLDAPRRNGRRSARPDASARLLVGLLARWPASERALDAFVSGLRLAAGLRRVSRQCGELPRVREPFGAGRRS